jgi:hypothetical protein
VPSEEDQEACLLVVTSRPTGLGAQSGCTYRDIILPLAGAREDPFAKLERKNLKFLPVWELSLRLVLAQGRALESLRLGGHRDYTTSSTTKYY